MRKGLRNNLESRILERVYKFEARRTLFLVLKYLIILFAILAFGILSILEIIFILNEQRSLDLLELFGEDREIFEKYIGEVLDTLYSEVPWDLVLVFIILSIALASLLFAFVRNFSRIRARAGSIIEYFKG